MNKENSSLNTNEPVEVKNTQLQLKTSKITGHF